MNILYITYIDLDGIGNSGSSVRPQKMYNAFKKLGVNIKLLACQQNKVKDRRKAVKNIIKWLDDQRPDICYIESPSGPIFSGIDLKLIRKIHRMNIPIGYFYRDAFWLFPEKQVGLRWWKRGIIRRMNIRALHTIEKNCDIVYVPTASSRNLYRDFKFKKCELLPPASDIVIRENIKSIYKYTCIYVGGVSYDYGTDILIDAFKMLNKKDDKYRLILICRPTEYNSFFPEPLNYSWLNVVHAEGNELQKYYSEASIGIMPAHKTPYLNTAMSVKIFEYLGYGLPIISTDTTEMGKFIRENKVGLVCDDTPESLAAAIEKFFNNCDKEALKKNVDAVAEQNSWVCRARQVIDELTRIKNENHSTGN